jgi:hypothetical protein
MRALVAGLCLMPLLVSAEIYRWTDAQGRVHFSERPAAGAQSIAVKPQVVERDAATREREAASERFHEARVAERTLASSLATEQQAKRAEQCRQARLQRERLPLGRTFFSTQANGERRYYSEQEVDAARRKADQLIKEQCP